MALSSRGVSTGISRGAPGASVSSPTAIGAVVMTVRVLASGLGVGVAAGGAVGVGATVAAGGGVAVGASVGAGPTVRLAGATGCAGVAAVAAGGTATAVSCRATPAGSAV